MICFNSRLATREMPSALLIQKLEGSHDLWYHFTHLEGIHWIFRTKFLHILPLFLAPLLVHCNYHFLSRKFWCDLVILHCDHGQEPKHVQTHYFCQKPTLFKMRAQRSKEPSHFSHLISLFLCKIRVKMYVSTCILSLYNFFFFLQFAIPTNQIC